MEITVIYESSEYPLEKLEELSKTNVCKECGDRLDLFRVSIKDNRKFLACTDWPRTHHKGIMRPPSRYEKEGLNSFNIEKRRNILTEEHGTTKALSTVIDKYQGVTSLTKPQAQEILEAVYPLAPASEITRAVLLCHSYGLNPLMKHIYLIPFKNAKTGKDDFVTVMGIGAKRLLATRRGSYSYVDDTPRVMTDDEEKRRHGSVDRAKVWFLTKLRDTTTGAEASGEGWWPANSQPYGTDKGNTVFNMASIRSESQALNRLFPGEMPVDVDVVSEEYAQGKLAEVKVEDVVEGEAREIDEPELGLGICPIHNVPLKKSKFGIFCPEKVEGTGRWRGKMVNCKGVKPAPEEKADMVQGYTTYIDMTWFTESLKKIQAKKQDWHNKDIAARLDAITGKKSSTVTEAISHLNKDQAEAFVKTIEDVLETL